MSIEKELVHIPPYEEFTQAIHSLQLNISMSFIHGMMCGYLCAGANRQGEDYLRALLSNKKEKEGCNARSLMFAVFTHSQQQINSLNFEFAMLLPSEEESLLVRAEAFSEWCEGFIQALTLVGISSARFSEEEAQEAFQHLIEFAELDCDTLEFDEEDENALMEVSEYTRMAVLRLHSDLVMTEKQREGYNGITH